MLMSARGLVTLAVGLATVSAAQAAPDEGGDGGNHSQILMIVGIVGAILALSALILAVQARGMAAHAAQEAGEARARANQNGGATASADAIAGVERVWSARLAAVELRLASGGGRAPSLRETDHSGSAVANRVEELERIVAGLTVKMKEYHRIPASSAAANVSAAGKDALDIAWPLSVAAETSAMNDVRQTLAEALKSPDPSARELLEKLRAADTWLTRKPSTSEVAGALAEISQLLLAALRRGAAVAPLDGSLLSDRVLAALRPSWKPFLPHLDCRSFYPGSTFDPEWMEDHTKSGLQRPVISEMLTWAVFEKHDKGRRIIAKAHVTAE